MMRKDSSSKNNNSTLILNSRHKNQSFVRIGDIVSPNNGIVQLNHICRNGSSKHVYQWKSKTFKLKHLNQILVLETVSTATKRFYECIVPSGTT